MRRALSMVRDDPHYRSDAIRRGLTKAGYTLADYGFQPNRKDALVIWNRYSSNDVLAQQYERVGAMVIVVENGYLGHHYNDHAKPFTKSGDQLYAMALHHHNGAGKWHLGEPGRWQEQGIEVQPWRTGGEVVLVLPQRGIGPEGVAMPSTWIKLVAGRLKQLTNRPVKIRQHPGNAPAKTPLSVDLMDAWCAVTWGSGAALKAICAGVPVFHDFKKWIGRDAALPVGTDIEQPSRNSENRQAMLDKLAWAQWSVPEIESGEPFVRLHQVYQGVT